MAYRPQFGSKQREALFIAERLAAYKAGRSDGTFCICNICGNPVYERDAWDESHHPDHPRVFGGKSVGVAHALCNRLHGAKVVKRAAAKSDRIRRRHIGALRAGMGPQAMPAGRRSDVKRTVTGRVVPRLTLAEKHQAFLAKRGILHQPEA